MIIIDYNAIAIGNIVTQRLDIQEDLIRHMILNSIRMYNKKFRNEYGQMVIACDSSSWRKDSFPQYKYKRKTGREESSMDWNDIFRIITMVREEIEANLPYKVIKIDGAEADDIIGALAIESQEFGKNEPIMIVSSDKDFIQLHKYDNVKQFSPMQKKLVKHDQPRTYILEHIFKGDSSDGVPNVLSPDNTFVDGIRQSPMTKKKIEHWIQNIDKLEDVMDQETYRNYIRNKTMISLEEMPKSVYQNIINRFNEIVTPHKMKVLNYLIKKRCKNLIESVEEFY